MELSKREFESIEGHFHDGLGTYAELVLANALITASSLHQAEFDLTPCERKMSNAIESLPLGHPSRSIFPREIENIRQAAKRAADLLISELESISLTRVQHIAGAFAGACAGDVLLHLEGHPPIPVSVKTDKSGKVAVADGQTPDVAVKWAARYCDVTPEEFECYLRELGYATIDALKSHYLNVAEFVAHTLIQKLGLVNCSTTDFSQACPTELDAVKHLLRQLLIYKRGSDGSRVMIFGRTTGIVTWETLLDSVDIDELTLDRVTFRPSRPRAGRRIGSEFAVKIDGKAVVTFQIKHRRGNAHGTVRQSEFSDITTRLLTS